MVTLDEVKQFAKVHNLHTLNDEDFQYAVELGTTDYMKAWHNQYVHEVRCESVMLRRMGLGPNDI